jgi:hypothetical protein
MTESPLNHLKTFKNLCGGDPYHKIALVTTHWKQPPSGIQLGREKEIRDKHWKKMTELGSKMTRFQGDRASAWDAVALLPIADY